MATKFKTSGFFKPRPVPKPTPKEQKAQASLIDRYYNPTPTPKEQQAQASLIDRGSHYAGSGSGGGSSSSVTPAEAVANASLSEAERNKPVALPDKVNALLRAEKNVSTGTFVTPRDSIILGLKGGQKFGGIATIQLNKIRKELYPKVQNYNKTQRTSGSQYENQVLSNVRTTTRPTNYELNTVNRTLASLNNPSISSFNRMLITENATRLGLDKLNASFSTGRISSAELFRQTQLAINRAKQEKAKSIGQTIRNVTGVNVEGAIRYVSRAIQDPSLPTSTQLRLESDFKDMEKRGNKIVVVQKQIEEQGKILQKKIDSGRATQTEINQFNGFVLGFNAQVNKFNEDIKKINSRLPQKVKAKFTVPKDTGTTPTYKPVTSVGSRTMVRLTPDFQFKLSKNFEKTSAQFQRGITNMAIDIQKGLFVGFSNYANIGTRIGDFIAGKLTTQQKKDLDKLFSLDPKYKYAFEPVRTGQVKPEEVKQAMRDLVGVGGQTGAVFLPGIGGATALASSIIASNKPTDTAMTFLIAYLFGTTTKFLGKGSELFQKSKFFKAYLGTAKKGYSKLGKVYVIGEKTTTGVIVPLYFFAETTKAGSQIIKARATGGTKAVRELGTETASSFGVFSVGYGAGQFSGLRVTNKVALANRYFELRKMYTKKFGTNAKEVKTFERQWKQVFGEVPREIGITQNFTVKNLEIFKNFSKKDRAKAVRITDKTFHDFAGDLKIIGSTTIPPTASMKQPPKGKFSQGDVDVKATSVSGGKAFVETLIYRLNKAGFKEFKLHKPRFTEGKDSPKYATTYKGQEFVNVGTSQSRTFAELEEIVNLLDLPVPYGVFKKTPKGIQLQNLRDQLRRNFLAHRPKDVDSVTNTLKALEKSGILKKSSPTIRQRIVKLVSQLKKATGKRIEIVAKKLVKELVLAKKIIMSKLNAQIKQLKVLLSKARKTITVKRIKSKINSIVLEMRKLDADENGYLTALGGKVSKPKKETKKTISTAKKKITGKTPKYPKAKTKISASKYYNYYYKKKQIIKGKTFYSYKPLKLNKKQQRTITKYQGSSTKKHPYKITISGTSYPVSSIVKTRLTLYPKQLYPQSVKGVYPKLGVKGKLIPSSYPKGLKKGKYTPPIKPVPPPTKKPPVFFGSGKQSGFNVIANSKSPFNVLMRRKGKLVKVNSFPLTGKSALKLLDLKLDNSPARSGYIAKTTGRPRVMKNLPSFKSYKYRKPVVNSKLKRYFIVEKTSYAIDTKGEKRGITAKGIATPKRKRIIKRTVKRIKRISTPQRKRLIRRTVKRIIKRPVRLVRRKRPVRLVKRKPLRRIKRRPRRTVKKKRRLSASQRYLKSFWGI